MKNGLEAGSNRGERRIKQPRKSAKMLAFWRNPENEVAKQERIRSLSESNASRAKTREKTYPIFIRGGSVRQAMQLTGLNFNQVDSLRDRLIRENKLKIDPEKRHLEKREIHIEAWKKKKGIESVVSSQEQKLIALATRLCGEPDFITEDTSCREELFRLYRNYGEPFPIAFGFYGELILEAFVIARKKAGAGDRDLLNRFAAIRNDADGGLGIGEFDGRLDEQCRFITARLAQRRGVRSVNNPAVIFSSDDFAARLNRGKDFLGS